MTASQRGRDGRTEPIPMSEQLPWTVRRLLPAHAAAYHELRLEGFTRHPRQFRVAPEDERELSLPQVGERLARTFVVGGFDADGLAGVGGLTRFDGLKLMHRALLWGMYVRTRARGAGLADELMRMLLEEARSRGIEQVILTVAAGNDRARRLYERWGFAVYGTEPRAIKLAEGYLDELLMSRRLT
jgi:ribosomal protein S18 acetylase RimI-like enzyme